MYLYHNGVQHSSTYSQTTSFADTDIGIGGRHYDGNERFQGRISNARYVRGTAVYTGSYTVPTENLTAVSGTELLTCNKPYIADQSSSPKTLTLNGGVFIDPSSPFGNEEYSKSNHGGSIYFDGSNDYVTTTSSNFALGTSRAFTIEFWYYFVESRTHTVFDFYDSTSAVGKLAFTSTNVYLFDGSSNILALTRTQRVGQWEHFCWTRDASNNHVFYINGEQVGTSTASTTIDVDIIDLGRRAGAFNNTFMYGHISDFSLTKGSVTRSAAFTPPTSPLSSTGTTLHIKGTDSTIVDKAQGIWHIRPEGNSAGSTTQTKFADSSIYLPASAKINCKELNFGAGDFTIESWVRSPSANSGYYGIFALEDRLMNGTATTGGLQLGFRTGNQFDLYHSDGTASTVNFTWSTDTWYHIALVRIGSTITLYVDGTSIGTVTSSTNYKPFKFLTVGMYYNTSYPLLGYIEDFRLTDGLARYPFIPPKETLSAITNTELLTAHASTIIDGSSNSHSITTNGNAAVSNVAPHAGMKSIEFDGTGDYLVVPDGDHFDFSAGSNYTLEAWIYPTTVAGSTWRVIANNGAAGQYSPIYLTLIGDKLHFLGSHNGSSYAIDTRSDIGSDGIATISANQWTHVAVVWDQTDYKFFINGGLKSTIAKTGDPMDPVRALGIGARQDGNEPFTGYISNLRLVKGTSVYSDSFAIPTSALTG